MAHLSISVKIRYIKGISINHKIVFHQSLGSQLYDGQYVSIDIHHQNNKKIGIVRIKYITTTALQSLDFIQVSLFIFIRD